MLNRRGQPIPKIQYTAEEVKTWGLVLRELTQLYPQHACQEFQQNFPLFNFQEDQVPQLEDMSRILKYAIMLRVIEMLGTFDGSCVNHV